ncbi:MAG: hypothetical protein FWC77_03110 [Defluviitaleaceae bacterium]|nr:hypothetical protein [Defluviitaleaceae bacterium]
MSVILFVLGFITIIAGIIIGLMTGSFLGFIASLAGSIFSSAIFFALARILEKQDEILTMLQSSEARKRNPIDTIKCTRCEKEYDSSCNNCPHCAFRP